ncbi:MAG: GNAT family N-acetyltransferase [Gemmatimonadota bacterium]|nr:GNAT family N-acetyltransferase [Gemmatimonadota bacterium]
MPLPTLHGEGLTLRPFVPQDADRVQRLAGAFEVADTTLNVPHPYPDGAAEAWILTHTTGWDLRSFCTLAVEVPETGIVGTMSLHLELLHRRGELGYWIGRPFWNRGYATRAARALLDFGFDVLDLNRVQAQYLVRNPASRRVMEKIGMRYEGTRRQYMIKWGVLEDVGCCALLAAER